MASEAEIQLGRLAVSRGLATQEQVLAALHQRNADPDGVDLGERLAGAGLLTPPALAELRAAVAGGAAVAPPKRHEAATDLEIPLGPAREMIARECLEEAKRFLASDPKAATLELRRLVDEFPDTESGNRARTLLSELERGTP